MNFLGIDPDLSTVAVACVNDEYTVNYLQVVRANGRDITEMAAALSFELLDAPYQYGGLSAFAVEAQELYLAKHVNPRDILHLGQVAGAALALCRARTDPHMPGYFPRPAEWKGQQDKLPHHVKILTKSGIIRPGATYKVMGGKDPYAVPLDPPASIFPGGEFCNDSDWKHLNDAIGLAQWARDRYHYEIDKAAALQAARTPVTYLSETP
jgi:hypothetical protein